MSHDAHDIQKSVRRYLLVFGALMVGTVLTVAVNAVSAGLRQNTMASNAANSTAVMDHLTAGPAKRFVGAGFVTGSVWPVVARPASRRSDRYED